MRKATDFLNPSTAIALGLHLPHPDDESLLEALARVPERLADLERVTSQLRPLGADGRLNHTQLVSLRDLLDGLGSLAGHYRQVAQTVFELKKYPPEFDLPYCSVLHGRTARALHSWRLSEHELSCVPPELTAEYDAAVRTGDTALVRFTTIGDLVRHYFSGRWREWLLRACGELPDGQTLWHGIVRETAFWRRACDLIAAASSGDQT